MKQFVCLNCINTSFCVNVANVLVFKETCEAK